MDAITLIVDASPLINRIHGLKQWIYDGSIRVVVPLCTLNEVERQYKASLAVKEAPKEPVAKKASGRASRREEQPLFDINPRTTWEFLSRERNNADSRVEFQKEGEEFSRWREEEDESVQPSESQREPPSSFSDALLRKLNITNGSDQPTIEDESKPQLVSRGSDSKSPWTTQKIPRLPPKTVPSNLQPFFSYALWKIYESGNDPTKPILYEIFTDDSRIKDVAEMLGIGIRDWAGLKSSIVERSQGAGDLSTYGQLERDFPSHKDPSRVPAPSKDGRHANNRENSDQATNAKSAATSVQAQVDQQPSHEQDHLNTASPLLPSPHFHQKRQLEQGDNVTNVSLAAQELVSTAVSGHIETAPSSHAQIVKKTETHANGAEASETKVQDDSDLDSDEEIIVFNPRAKRGSWRPKTPAGASEPSHSRPVTANGPKPEDFESPKPAKSPIKSALKPQSPVFTPGQLYSPVGTLTENGQAATTHAQTNGDVSRIPKSPARSPVLSQSKPTTGHGKTKQAPTSDDRRQQSGIIIQRQREAIHRQTTSIQKPPPRRVQKEPTDNPTIIDPDAFDRSYVVQPLTQTNERGGKRRSGPKHKHGTKGSAQQANAANPEQEDDFVLKSGAPRGSMRGKGKLFVP